MFYKQTPAALLIVPGKSLVGDRGKGKNTLMGKDPLLFEKLIFRSRQTVRVNDSRISVVAVKQFVITTVEFLL